MIEVSLLSQKKLVGLFLLFLWKKKKINKEIKIKELQKVNEEAKQRAIGKYFMLSEEDKIDMVEAITHIICKAESEGTSHRGLQSALGIYPTGFWVDHLMDVHNALWSYYHDKKQEQELKDDLDSLENFIDKIVEPD